MEKEVKPNFSDSSKKTQEDLARELGIRSVMCDVHTYNNDDEILQDLLETNIRQRGNVGGSAKKVGMRIKELERIYGIEHGAISFQGNQHKVVSGNFCHSPQKTQEDLARENNMSGRTYRNFKTLADMIPELDELEKTGIVTKSTALAIMKQLSEEEFGGCTSTTSLLFRESPNKISEQ